MEGTRYGVSLDSSLCKISAHVPAVRVENVDPPILPREHDERGPECIDLVRLAVNEVAYQSEAVPTASVALRRCAGIDDANLILGVG
jgi:hypothetical protein